MKPVFFALIGMFFWGMAPILGKIGLVKVNPTLALAVRSFLISGVMLVWLLATRSYGEITHTPLRSWMFIAGEGVLASLLGHLAYYWALKFGEASRVTPVIAAYPLLTVIVAVLVLGEQFTWTKVAGAALILAGILLIGR
ncbi:membrane protein [Clostridiales bacterium PH28_bin88]|nr:membrane protein [Clostridiales bacterium PH28_bin88]